MIPPPPDRATATVAFEGVDFAIDHARPNDPTWVVLGVRKSGSSMFNNAVKALSRFAQVNWVDVPGDLFDANVPAPRWRDVAPPQGLLAPGNAYGGFRAMPAGMAADPVFVGALKVLLVRDPRDALVSEYFSTAFTHSLPAGADSDGAGVRETMLRQREAAQQGSVDEFARRNADRMARTIEAYLPLLADPRLLVLHYEDVVFEKAAMLRAVANHFGWRLPPGAVEAILPRIDVMPAQENPAEFIRKVTPGDHREKLSREVIAEIDERFAPAMKAFGYD